MPFSGTFARPRVRSVSPRGRAATAGAVRLTQHTEPKPPTRIIDWYHEHKQRQQAGSAAFGRRRVAYHHPQGGDLAAFVKSPTRERDLLSTYHSLVDDRPPCNREGLAQNMYRTTVAHREMLADRVVELHERSEAHKRETLRRTQQYMASLPPQAPLDSDGRSKVVTAKPNHVLPTSVHTVVTSVDRVQNPPPEMQLTVAEQLSPLIRKSVSPTVSPRRQPHTQTLSAMAARGGFTNPLPTDSCRVDRMHNPRDLPKQGTPSRVSTASGSIRSSVTGSSVTVSATASSGPSRGISSPSKRTATAPSAMGRPPIMSTSAVY